MRMVSSGLGVERRPGAPAGSAMRRNFGRDGLRRIVSQAAVSALLPWLGSTIVGAAGLIAQPSTPAVHRTWRITGYALSPDGTRVAELRTVRSGTSRYDEIRIDKLESGGGSERTVYRGTGLSHLVWLSNRHVAFAGAGRENRVMMANLRTGRVATLAVTAQPVVQLIPEPNGHRVAYGYYTWWSWGRAVSVKVTPNISIDNLVLPTALAPWHDMTFHFGILRWNARGGTVLQRGAWPITMSIPYLVWSGGRLLALRQSMTGYRKTIYDVERGESVYSKVPLEWMRRLVVSTTGRMAVISTGRSRHTEAAYGTMRVYIVDGRGRVHAIPSIAERFITAVWWVGRDEVLVQVYVRRRRAGPQVSKLVRVNVDTGAILHTYQWPHGQLGDSTHLCSIDLSGDRAVCRAQTLTDPPRLVFVNVKSGAMQPLDRMSSDAKPLSFKFRRVVIRNRFGNESVAFLALPSDWRHLPVPLAVMAYGFDEVYSRYGQWITSYPVARLVRSGIAVLLLNFPRERTWTRGRFQEVLRREISSPLSTVENAVPAVRRLGVRVSRTMIMGWSWGGLIASFAMQKSHQFVAAQVGDPQDWTTVQYAMNDAWGWRMLDSVFGGPPDQKYIAHYLALDPVADGKPAHGPILFEFVRRNLPEGQFLSEWRAAGTDVQAFAYRNSIHWLDVPAEARISRARNFDWARLNLLGPHSVSCAELRRVGLTVPATGWWTSRDRSTARGRSVRPSCSRGHG